MQKFKTYLLENLEKQLDIIENSCYETLTEYQAGYISALNFLIDLILNYNDSSNERRPQKEAANITPGWTFKNHFRKESK